MTEENSAYAGPPLPNLPEEKGSWLQTIFKILFFFAAFVLVILTLLANMGGNSQTHKESVEQFFTEVTGHKARIKTLNNLSFFPTIRTDLEDLDIFMDASDDIPGMHVDRLQMAFGFWDAAMRNGKAKGLNVQGVHILPGVLLERAIDLKRLAIVDLSEARAALEAEGEIGNRSFSMTMDMAASGSKYSRKYEFPLRRDFDIKLGDAALKGTFENSYNPSIQLQNINATLKGEGVVAGHLDISTRRAHEITFGGAIVLPEYGTALHPDLIYDVNARKLSGTITSDNFNPADFAASSRFNMLLKAMIDSLGNAEHDKNVLDDYFSAQDVTLDVKGKAVYKGPLVFKNNLLFLK